MNKSSNKKRSRDGGDPKLGKRKRRDDGGAIEDRQHHRGRASPTTRKTSSLLFQGKVFAVSTLVEASSEESPEAYSQIVSLCKDLGAQTTGQVHRRVNAVIASMSAVEGKTQRVRKAWKKGIPVVSPDWIRECMKQGRSLDMGPYTQQQQSEEKSPESKKPKRKQAKDSRNNDDAVKPKDEEVNIDLGCCCVCHETATGTIECAWCVDCTVSRRHKKEKESARTEKEVTIDLGCCCACHEENSGRTECSWCIECSVNKQFAE